MDNKLIELIEKIFDVSLGGKQLKDINPQTVANWDSMGHLNLVLSMQDEFSVDFDEDEIADMTEGAEEIIKILNKHGVE